jgi:TorA-specific chaperone
MQEFIEFNEQRAQVYWWLSSLFAKELTESDLSHYQTSLQPFLNALGEHPTLTNSVIQLKSAIAAQGLRQDGQLELAADFCGLFLGDPKTGALPYASIYLGESGALNDKPAQIMLTWLDRFNVTTQGDFSRVPQDHIAIELDFLGNLIIQANQSDNEEKQENFMQNQLEFMQSVLVPWIGLFAKRCHVHDPFGFYAAAANLLTKFIAIDVLFLQGE